MEPNTKTLFQTSRPDKIMAWIYFLVGYAFIYTFTSYEFERNIGIFTVLYAAAVLAYCRLKKVHLSRESYFWMIILLSIGIPFAFWSVFPILQIFVLILLAAYWTLTVTGCLLADGSTSKYVFFDMLNGICLVPFSNFDAQFRSLSTKTVTKTKTDPYLAENISNEERSHQKSPNVKSVTENISNAEILNSNNISEKQPSHIVSILLGAAISIVALLVILPLLSKADAGFEKLLSDVLRYISEHLMATILRIIAAVPVACFLYGLIYGGIHKRNTNGIKTASLQAAGKSVRIVPDAAIGTAMIIICLVYVLFVALQGNYMFSAFAGTLPAEFTYAEYARRGFFELCGIGAWNLFLIWSFELFSEHERKENKMFRILAICLSVLTLLIIATAISKMGMYIVVYGLTVKRVLTMVFMIWMIIVFAAVIVQQKKETPNARICIVTGAVLFALLCVFPIENWIELYNCNI